MNKKTGKQKKWVLLPILLFIMAACEKVAFEPVEIPTDDVSYAADIQPIWDANCISCHPPTMDLDLNADVSYEQLVPDFVSAADSLDPQNSALYSKLVGSSHASRTSDPERALIQKWITQGVPNN